MRRPPPQGPSYPHPPAHPTTPLRQPQWSQQQPHAYPHQQPAQHVPLQPSAMRECAECGAPPLAGLAACKYCKTAYPGVQSGVRCPRCADINVHGSAACISCRTSLAVGCLFCGTASPLDRPACIRCGEAFAGAIDRKQARDAHAQQTQYIGLAVQGVQLLGTVAAAAPRGTGSAIFDALGGILGEITKD